MATTGVNFVLQNKSASTLVGGAVKGAPFVQALDPTVALEIAGRVAGGAATAALGSNNGNFLVDGYAAQGFAKNGAFHATTSGTTPVTVDLTNLATGATSNAGDTGFAAWNKITVMNCGAADMTLAPGASNGNAILGGTTPTVTVPAGGSRVVLENLAGKTVDATHKNLTITPTAGGDVVVAVGGS